MKSNKFLLGGIAGGIAFFLLGWVVWGMLLMDFMKQHTKDIPGVFRDENDMIWWAMILHTFALGFLYSYVIGKSNASSAGSGAGVGAVVGFLMSLAYDMVLYAQMDLWDLTSLAVDVAAMTVVSTIVGALIGWIYGMGRRAT